MSPSALRGTNMARGVSGQARFRGADVIETEAEEEGLSAVLRRGEPASLLERQLILNRAVEVYIDQVATASVFAIRDGFACGYRFFEVLAQRVQQDGDAGLTATTRLHLASLGISKGVAFKPDWWMKALLAEAARLGATIARAARLVYSDRRWEWAFVGVNNEAEVRTGRPLNCAIFADRAIGVAPRLMSVIADAGSQFLWTPCDAEGALLDGGKRYRLRLPAGVPVANYWSVVAYDAQGCKALQSAPVFPTVSKLSGPKPNRDGSVDILFGPRAPRGRAANWVETADGNAWFPLLRFDGATAPFFEQSWLPSDIEPVR
jgi:hypothetical protein